MSRQQHTNFAIITLLSLSLMSVTVTVVLLIYSSIFQLEIAIIRKAEIREESVVPSIRKAETREESVVPLRQSVEFVDFDYKERSRSLYNLDQKEKKLWKFIRNKHVSLPSIKRYNMTSKNNFHPNEYSLLIRKMFNNKRGIFVEAGAYDGEAASNTLFLEEHGWQGLLIECNPIILPKLMSKNRKAWIANTCLSLTKNPQKMNFTTPVDWPASAKLGKPLNDKEMKDIGIDWMKNKTWLEYQVDLYPLYAIIKAVGKFRHIDFLSLDVEGSEIAILKHFPFEEIKIYVIFVEVRSFTEAEKADLNKFLSRKGYLLLETMEFDQLYAMKSWMDVKLKRH